MSRVVGPDWRAEVDRRLPGAAEQMRRDTGTFFDSDLPALLAWRLDAEDVQLAGADHTLALTHTSQVADVLADFYSRHHPTASAAAE